MPNDLAPRGKLSNPAKASRHGCKANGIRQIIIDKQQPSDLAATTKFLTITVYFVYSGRWLTEDDGFAQLETRMNAAVLNPANITARLAKKLIPIAAVPLLLIDFSSLAAGQIITNVNVIIEKLPLDKQEKMKDFHSVVEDYIENAPWFEEDNDRDMEVTLQLFLTDIPTNIEDRYRCEFLISSSDVQYFDKRVYFAYQPGEVFVYNEQSVEPHTGVIDFYVNLILGNEFDKIRSFGGDFYYKRAQNVAALGKFVRTEFIRGWTERDELIKKVFQEPFKTFREMKDYYFYGLYIREENKDEARSYVRTALDKLASVLDKKADLEQPGQFLNAHYLEIIDLFKDSKDKNAVFELLIKLDPDHKALYEEHASDS